MTTTTSQKTSDKKKGRDKDGTGESRTRTEEDDVVTCRILSQENSATEDANNVAYGPTKTTNRARISQGCHQSSKILSATTSKIHQSRLCTAARRRKAIPLSFSKLIRLRLPTTLRQSTTLRTALSRPLLIFETTRAAPLKALLFRAISPPSTYLRNSKIKYSP